MNCPKCNKDRYSKEWTRRQWLASRPIVGGDRYANCCQNCQEWDPNFLCVLTTPPFPDALNPLFEWMRQDDIVYSLQQFAANFEDGKSRARKLLSHRGSIAVLHAQTLLVKEKHLMDHNGEHLEYGTASARFRAHPWQENKPPTRRTVMGSVFYDPTNSVYQRVWQELWSDKNVQHHYNAETVGDVIEALCALYIRKVITGWAYPNFIDPGHMAWIERGGYFVLCQIVAWITWQMGLPESNHVSNGHGHSTTSPPRISHNAATAMPVRSY